MKLIVPEQGSAEVAAAWLGADRRISSLVLYPEARAAIARARRMGRLRQREHARARRRMEALWGALDRLDLTEPLAREAGELADSHGLRAYDAVHLASAASVADADTVLITADGELLTAARALGLTTIRPVG